MKETIKTPIDMAKALLERLNHHYETTGDSETGQKIIELVDTELEQEFIADRDDPTSFIGLSAIITAVIVMFTAIFLSKSFVQEHIGVIGIVVVALFVVVYIGLKKLMVEVEKTSIYRVYKTLKPISMSNKEAELIQKYSVGRTPKVPFIMGRLTEDKALKIYEFFATKYNVKQFSTKEAIYDLYMKVDKVCGNDEEIFLSAFVPSEIDILMERLGAYDGELNDDQIMDIIMEMKGKGFGSYPPVPTSSDENSFKS